MSSGNGHYGYIDDGFTLDGRLNAVERLYPALKFKYRPILITNRSAIFSAIAKCGDDSTKAEAIAARAIKAQLVEWDLKNRKGELVPLEVASILRLQPTLNQRLFSVCMGSSAPDADPDEKPESLASNEALERALAGMTPEQIESADVGNLPAA